MGLIYDILPLSDFAYWTVKPQNEVTSFKYAGVHKSHNYINIHDPVIRNQCD